MSSATFQHIRVSKELKICPDWHIMQEWTVVQCQKLGRKHVCGRGFLEELSVLTNKDVEIDILTHTYIKCVGYKITTDV